MSGREMLPVMILAGGLGTRLRPVTQAIPKALVNVAGKPFICRQLEYLRAQGIERVILCIGYRGEQIEALVGDGTAFDLRVSYSPDGPTLLGTGGAVKRALALTGGRFFVLYGDSFLPCDFGRVEAAFVAGGRPALMTVLRNADRWDKSNVEYRDGAILEYDKRHPRAEMEHIDYGLGVFSGPVFDVYPCGEAVDLADVYHALSVRGQLAGYEVFQRFYEIGSPEGLRDAEAYFLGEGGK